MKHIVFLVGSYYPYFSAVGTCCFNIAEEIVKENKVTVVCMKSRIGQLEQEEFHGQTIIRVSHRWWDTRLKLDENIKKSSSIIKKLYILLLNIVRAKEYLQIVFSRMSLNKGWIRSYQRALENITDQIDVIIPLCFPMEAVIAGINYKKKVNETKLIPYLFDQFVERKELHKLRILMSLKMDYHLDIEKDMIDFSDKLLVIHSLQKHFKTYFPKAIKKIQFVEHPLLKLIYLQSPKEQKKGYLEGCILVFTGALLKGYVMPDYMLNLLLSVNAKMNFTLNLYIGGNCENTIEKYQRLIPDTIINHGYVDKKTAVEAITSSNILISIAEIKGIQVSSKIFEYMSTGKPIVHFYTADNDINVRILKDYPLCLCIKQDDSLINGNAEKFIKFCHENKGKTLNFREVERIYYHATPKFIAEQMMEIIDRGENP